MDFSIEGPVSSATGLDELMGLYGELHGIHVDVATYGPLVRDAAVSWGRRIELYRHALRDEQAVYFVARSAVGQAIGYAFALPSMGVDDTFETCGTVELITLVVAARLRGQGVGRRLVRAVELYAASIGADTVKVAVMAGNAAAENHYAQQGYRPGETLFYKRVD